MALNLEALLVVTASGGKLPLASSEQRPEMLVNFLQCTGLMVPPPTIKNYLYCPSDGQDSLKI